MYTIQGKVIVKGTPEGVPDLVVVAYDLDPLLVRQVQNQTTGFPPQQRFTDDDLRTLLTDRATRSWVDFPGDRLGSVLTDEQGRFRLELDDTEFKKGNAEHWPDLVLFVLAPSQAASKSSVVGG